MVSSPAWNNSSSSSSPSSSSMRSTQAFKDSSSPSISSMRDMQASKVKGIMSVALFFRYLVFFSTKVISHSRARFRSPVSATSLERATVAMNCAVSAAFFGVTLKKSGSSVATSISAWRHSDSMSSSFAWARPVRTCRRTGSVPASGAQAFFSVSDTMSQTRRRTATLCFNSGEDRPFSIIGLSCSCAPIIDFLQLPSRSFSNRIAASQLPDELAVDVLAILKTRGSKSGQPLVPGCRCPEASSWSHTYSASMEMTSPIFF
mmetsp:Transcript_46029/g.82879  ORF Transcript_46029/g.82879 Transcript_46029/m.82879 type:complete len:261 (-) Transcript_46029:439-1221(-)